jgi:hypothetical protein
MDAELLQRVLNLAEKTGDRVIVVNPESGEAHAVLPLDAYEDLVDGVENDVSLRELGDWAGDNENGQLDFDDLISEPSTKDEQKIPSPATDEEIEKLVQHDLDIIKLAEQSEKEAEVTAPIDMLEDEANEEQYYLEPLE